MQGQEGETQDVRELKRLQAVRLYGSGPGMSAVLTVVGTSRRTIQRWVADDQEQGLTGLKAHWASANAQTWRDAQRAELVQRLQQDAPDHRLSSEVRVSQGPFWTVREVQVAVQQGYGVDERTHDSYRERLDEAGFSYPRSAGVSRSKPSQDAVAAFEPDLEKKSSTFDQHTPLAGS